MAVIAPKKLWQPYGQPRQDAADGPHIACLGLLFEGEHVLWRTLPARRDVLGEQPGFDGASEAKAKQFQDAVCITQKVYGLEVSVHDGSALSGFQRAEGLVDKVTGRG